MKKVRAGDQYECECCRGTFTANYGDEVARQEAGEVFGRAFDEDDAARVCDGCYEKIMKAIAVGQA